MGYVKQKLIIGIIIHCIEKELVGYIIRCKIVPDHYIDSFAKKMEKSNILIYLFNKLIQSLTNYNIRIDWKRVAEDYRGIETRENMMEKRVVKKYNRRFKFIKRRETGNMKERKIYLYLWLGSGCIWDPDAIKKIKRIYKI